MSVCVEARAESPRGGTSHYLAQNLVLYRSSGVSRELGPTPAPRHAVGGCGTNGHSPTQWQRWVDCYEPPGEITVSLAWRDGGRCVVTGEDTRGCQGVLNCPAHSLHTCQLISVNTDPTF